MVTNPSRAFELNANLITPLDTVAGSGSGVERVKQGSRDEDMFGSIFQSVLHNVNTTNSYLSQAENEEIRFAMGEADSGHDLAVALQKASISLQYTVAVKNQFMEAYRQIMQMQI